MTESSPHSPDIEKVVLASMLTDRDSCARALEACTGDAFYVMANRLVFLAIKGLVESGSPLGVVEVAEYLDGAGNLEKVGDAGYLSEILEAASATTETIEYYLDILRRKLTARRLIAMCEMTTAACKSTDDIDKVLRRAERGLASAVQTVTTRELEPLSVIVGVASEEIDRIYEANGTTGIPTGLTKVDQYTGGLQPGDLVILAGRPSMGKTSYALSMALAAAKLNKRVAVFSLEMGKTSLVQRFVSMEAMVDLFLLRTGRLPRDRFGDVVTGMAALSALPISIDDSTDTSAIQILSKCRTLRDIELIIVDYLQLMDGEGRSPREQVGNNTRSLKKLAKSLQVPVVALSQLSRANESMGKIRPPRLSDLRETGQIEQDADVVLFCHRPEMYKKTPENAGYADIIIGKQRNGPAGLSVTVGFKKQYSLFHCWDRTFPQEDEW